MAMFISFVKLPEDRFSKTVQHPKKNEKVKDLQKIDVYDSESVNNYWSSQCLAHTMIHDPWSQKSQNLPRISLGAKNMSRAKKAQVVKGRDPTYPKSSVFYRQTMVFSPGNLPRFHYKQKPFLIALYWVVYRDSSIGLWKSPTNWVALRIVTIPWWECDFFIPKHQHVTGWLLGSQLGSIIPKLIQWFSSRCSCELHGLPHPWSPRLHKDQKGSMPHLGRGQKMKCRRPDWHDEFLLIGGFNSSEIY